MGKHSNKFKKGLSATIHGTSPATKANQEYMVKQFAIADLKKTAMIIAVLFALEFLIFYANLMGTGA